MKLENKLVLLTKLLPCFFFYNCFQLLKLDTISRKNLKLKRNSEITKNSAVEKKKKNE